MDRNSIPGTIPPAQQAPIPEEDAHLLAIEALEARSVDSNPSPLSVPVTPAEQPAVTPLQPPTTPVQPIAPVHAQKVGVGVKDPVPPIPQKVKELKKPATPAEAIAEELAGSPGTTHYQFFTYNKPPRKPFVIFGILAILIGLGVGAYFTLR